VVVSCWEKITKRIDRKIENKKKRQQPTTNNQQPATNNQQPTTNNQQPK
jgi:hypothetical protein